MKNANRRQFLYWSVGIASAAGAAAWRLKSSPAEISAVADDEDVSRLRSFTRTSRALGSDVSITALHDDERTARRAVDAAFDELELVESLMSIYRPASQLSRLNRDGLLDDPHPHFVEVLQQARSISKQSGGAFDVTVQPLWSLFSDCQQAGRRPDGNEIAAARKLVDWRRVEISNRRLRLRGAGTAITLNGIAQGFAADQAMAALQSHDVAHALVDTGELGSLGRKASGKAWTVGIQHPRREDAYISLAQLAGRCLATSGDYSTTFGEDFQHHHLFDPRTGRSSRGLASVSVAADRAMLADALSTAVFVLGSERGLQLVRSTPGADALLVEAGGNVISTEGFPHQV